MHFTRGRYARNVRIGACTLAALSGLIAGYHRAHNHSAAAAVEAPVTTAAEPVAGPSAPSSEPPAALLAGPSVDEFAHLRRVRVRNARCPIDAKPVGGSNHALEPLTRRHKDTTVGFCCNWCASIWDAMTDSTRAAAFAAATAPPPKPAPTKPASKPAPTPTPKPAPKPASQPAPRP